MKEISKTEKKEILARFPDAEIVRTRHRAYLVGSNLSEPGKFLRCLRNPNYLNARARRRNNEHRTKTPL